MRNDFESNYLAHHGILGMKWGKKNGPPYPLGASDHSASEKKAGWRQSLKDDRARRAKEEADQAHESYKKKIRQVNERAQKEKDRITKGHKPYLDAMDKKAERRQKDADYNRDIPKNVKDYEKKFNAWTEAQDKNDEAWESVKEKRKAIGKTPLTRTLNAIFKTDDPKVKEYAKAYDEWSDKQDILDQQWNEVQEAYSKTGKLWVTRIANNIKYGEPIVEKKNK